MNDDTDFGWHDTQAEPRKAEEEFPPLNGKTLTIATLLVALAAYLSHIFRLGFAG